MSETKLAGRYVLVERIAAGGMGAVHRATDERLGRDVAVKILREELAGDPRFVERFRREARAVAALSHPNIAGVFDYGEEEDHYFIVMEYVDGKDLAQVMRVESPLGHERAARIAAQTLDALQHAHSAGVIHRDIKPGNIMVTTGGQAEKVKVTDFGIARAVGDSTLTATGSVLGTAHYLSPEQASGGDVGPSSDQYSTGIVLYEMLVGTVPFTGDSPVAIAMRHMSDELPAPSTLNPDVPPELDAIVARSTSKEASARFRDAAAMADALRGAQAPMTGRAPVAAGGGGATSVLAGSGDTAVLGDTPSHTQGGFSPAGDRWDPQRVGRAVLLSFVALIVVALLLLAFRLFTSDDEPTRSQRNRDRGAVDQPADPAPTEEPEDEIDETDETVIVPNDLVGETFEEAERLLDEVGLTARSSSQPSDEFPANTVIDASPGPGSTVTRGDTVTLTVSTGPQESDEDEDDDDEDDDEEGDKSGPPEGKGPKDKSQGKGPKDKD